MPRHDHLYVHCPKTKLVPCNDCGNMIEVGYKTRSPKRCIACGESAEAKAIREMAGKFGESWEKWIISMTAYLTSVSGGDTGGSENIPR